jgi:hypothetical protein
MQAPPGKPDRDRKKGDEAVLAAISSRARTIEFLKATPDLRDHVTESFLGPMDAYQWLLYASAHTERHTKQIEEVKAGPNFPKE